MSRELEKFIWVSLSIEVCFAKNLVFEGFGLIDCIPISCLFFFLIEFNLFSLFFSFTLPLSGLLESSDAYSGQGSLRRAPLSSDLVEAEKGIPRVSGMRESFGACTK